jgi:hypothetical protein
MALLLTLPATLAAQRDTALFPHAKHAKLFPLCSSCHAGVNTGERARTYPAVALCATCHDGTIQPRVRWAAPAPKGAELLVFTHTKHASEAKDVPCESCHAVGDARRWMSVARATPELCIACHTHAAPSHLADVSKCATCHRPLAAAVALTDARVAGGAVGGGATGGGLVRCDEVRARM